MGFYVYELVLNPGAQVCYVGKGSGNRAWHYRTVLANPRHHENRRHLYVELRRRLAVGKTVEARIVYETDDEIDALLKEKALIEHYGFDMLFNVATHAFVGRRLKPSVRLKLAAATRRSWQRGVFANRHDNTGRKFPNKKMPRGWFPKTRRGVRHRGVSRWTCGHKTPKWMARITIDGRTVNLGYFVQLTDAMRCYDDKAETLHGVRPNKTRSTSHATA